MQNGQPSEEWGRHGHEVTIMVEVITSHKFMSKERAGNFFEMCRNY